MFEKRDNKEPLTEKDVENISEIKGRGKKIKDLTGLEKCRSLASIDLSDNEIENLTPIKDLKGIQTLALAKNKIQDLKPIAALTAVSAVVACVCVLLVGWRAAVLLVPALLLGLFHRRLKGIPYTKPAYITTAWMMVTVGLPAIVGSAAHIVPVTAILAFSISANIIASSVRDGETLLTSTLALRVARGLAFAGVVVALADSNVLALAGIPVCTCAALTRKDLTERYGLIVVDGALLVGAIFAIIAHQ